MTSPNKPKSITRKQFLRLGGAAAAGGLIGLAGGCSDTPVNDDPPPIIRPRTYTTDLRFQLIDGLSGQPHPGYVILPSGEKKFSDSGLIELEFSTQDMDETVQLITGLAQSLDDPASYERPFAFNIHDNPYIVGDRDHQPFYLYDFDAKPIQLLRDNSIGGDQLSIISFKEYLKESHFNASFSGYVAQGRLIRWTETANGFNPEKLVFTKKIHYTEEGVTHSFGDDFEETVANYTQQMTNVIQPFLKNNILIEVQEEFAYTDRRSVDNIILVAPDPTLVDRGLLGDVFVRFTAPSTAHGSRIRVRSPPPPFPEVKKSYDDWLFLHEVIGPAGYNTTARPTQNVRLDQSVLPNRSSHVPGIPHRIPPVDVTALRFFNNDNYETGSTSEELLRIPEKYAHLENS